MRLLFALVLCCSAACGGGGGGLPTGASPIMARVLFHYEAKLEQRTEQHLCNGVARIYPSWWGSTHTPMFLADEGSWAAFFENVPVGKQSVRIVPPLGCENPNLVANDVAVTSANERLIFAFVVHPDGSVTH